MEKFRIALIGLFVGFIAASLTEWMGYEKLMERLDWPVDNHLTVREAARTWMEIARNMLVVVAVVYAADKSQNVGLWLVATLTFGAFVIFCGSFNLQIMHAFKMDKADGFKMKTWIGFVLLLNYLVISAALIGLFQVIDEFVRLHP